MIQTLLSGQLNDQYSDTSITDPKQLQQSQQDCPLCPQPSLQILINNAMFNKYLDTQYINCLRYIDNIMDNQICTEAINHKQMAIIDQDQEFMRRMYNLSQYDYKNKAIVQYYKFHHDYPKLHIKGVSNIMEHYYDRKKQFQYKKIKRVLKEEQNISITTQKSSQIFSDIQDQQKKSHYSNVLNDLTQNSMLFTQQNNESLVWNNMCKKIDKAFQNKNLSPINFKKKTIFDQLSNKQSNQTKNFVNYLKKQQQKKEKQQKYKNFIRSNKQSKYNSIQHIQIKQYASGISSDSNFIKKLAKKQKAKPFNSFKGTSAFYDGKMFYNSNGKSNGSLSKDQKTKQQSNAPSQQNLEYDYITSQNAFKKNKQTLKHNVLSNKRQLQEDRQVHKNKLDQLNTENFKNKLNFKTTEEIYKNAAQDMKLKKRSISYNSLANTNSNSKRSSLINILALKQKDFQIKNRGTSQNSKLLKQKNGMVNQINSKRNMQNLTRMQRAKSTNNFRTSRSVPKFYANDIPPQSQNKLNHNSSKKISVPKQIIQSLKGKSFSTSKLKQRQSKYNTQSKQKSGQGSQKLTKNYYEKQICPKQKKKDINLFIENGLRNKEQKNDIFFSHSSNNANIQKLLNKKLTGFVQTQKIRQHKILI